LSIRKHSHGQTQSWTKIVVDEEVGTPTAQWHGIYSVWWAIADADYTGMTATVTTDITGELWLPAFNIFSVTGHDPTNPFKQVDYSGATKSGGDSESHTASLTSAPTLGNLVVGLFSAQNDAVAAYTVPSGFSTIVNSSATSVGPLGVYRNDTTSTDIAVTDLGNDIWWVQAAALEIRVPTVGGDENITATDPVGVIDATSRVIEFVRTATDDVSVTDATSIPVEVQDPAQVFTGTVWDSGLMMVWNGSSWDAGILKTWQGSFWENEPPQ